MKDVDTCAAFETWKAGTRLFPIMSQRDFDTAIRQFEAALALDPDFARAYGWLAYCYITGLVDAWTLRRPVGSATPKNIQAEAKRLAKLAVSLDPCDFDTHWAMGFVLLHTGNAAGARRHFETARRLNFGNRELLVENADERVYAGDHNKAIELIMRARSIPDWQRWVLAWAYYFKARKDPIFYDLALCELQNMKDPAGRGKAPAEILILLAAIHGQKSKLSRKQAATDCRHEANRCRMAYERLRRKKRSLKDLQATNPFTKDKDRDHWRSGLKAAGF
jgi:tetratricopeptide (TPR) repeat protein